MRSFVIISLLFIILSCNSESQNSQNILNKDSLILTAKEPEVLSHFIVDSIPDIKTGTKERSSTFIKNRIESLIGNFYKTECEKINVNYPPKFVLFRAFKHEEEYEIWVSNKRSDTLKLLATLPICAVDRIPGPKIRRGDGKTPEGFYTCKILYGSLNDFMWIKLNTSELDDFGSVSYGSSFKLCLEYPLSIDRSRTRNLLENVNPGSAICIHGNCVTAGCISFENKNFLPIFLSSRFHNSDAYGYPKIHIFPFRFTEDKIDKFSKEVSSYMKPDDLIAFWNEIKVAYDLFEKNHKAIKVSFAGNKYNFTEY